MNRPKYKEMYLNERNRANIFKKLLNLTIENLKSFDLNVTDREQKSLHQFATFRQILIEQDDLHRFCIQYDKKIEGDSNE